MSVKKDYISCLESAQEEIEAAYYIVESEQLSEATEYTKKILEKFGTVIKKAESFDLRIYKSCPFCGSDDIVLNHDSVRGRLYIYCNKCNCRGPDVHDEGELRHETLKKLWNERA